jgi:hypothetical protein
LWLLSVDEFRQSIAVTDLAVPRPKAHATAARRRTRAWEFVAHPAVVFALLSLLFGSLLIVLTPPLRGPDEAAHFLRAYGVAQGELLPSLVDEKGRKGVLLPARLHDGFAFFEAVHAGERKAFADVIAKARGPGSPATRERDLRPAVPVLFEGSEGYSPVAYLAHAAAVFLAGLADADFATTLFSMRAAGLLAATAIAAYAVAIVPRQLAWAFLAIAMLPAALYGRAVISADGAAFATAMLVAGLCLRGVMRAYAQAPTALTFWIALCVLSKPPNIALALLPAMMWPLRDLTRHPHALAWIVLPGVLVAAMWTALSAGDAGAWRLVELTGRPAEQFDPAWKLLFMWEQPLHFPIAVAAALSDIPEWWRQLIGVLGLFDTVLRLWVYPMLSLMLVATLFAPLNLSASLRLRVATIAGLAVLSYCLAVFVIAYLVWTPVDADQVWGVQGRYFLSALPMLAIAIAALVGQGIAVNIRTALAVGCALLSGAAAVEAVLRVDWKVF